MLLGLTGRRLGPLRYECDRCHRVQLIAHPMYRYQPDPLTFGTDTWACHAGCGTYTHWRIVADDANRIPPEECPETWGRRDEWIREIREARMDGGGPNTQAATHAAIAIGRERLRNLGVGMAWNVAKLVVLGVIYYKTMYNE